MTGWLATMTSLGMQVGWATVLTAWLGVPGVTRATVIEEANRFANRLLSDGEYSDELLELSEATSDERMRLEPALSKLATDEGYDRTLELRKWRLVLTMAVLNKLPDDPVQSLVELMGFWSDWEFPADAPRTNHGDSPELAPPGYYTQASREWVLAQHAEWIRAELLQLCAAWGRTPSSSSQRQQRRR